jgi:hypothetical protein
MRKIMNAYKNNSDNMIDREIIDHYWKLAMQRKSLVSLEDDHLEYEFYLNEDDFQLFPKLRGLICLILWEEDGKVKYETR